MIPGTIRRGIALYRQTVCEPVFLARDIVGDLGETELLEPPRGSGAEISLIVVAVDEHRPFAVELTLSTLVELPQGDTDRPGEVYLPELRLLENLDDLRTSSDQIVGLTTFDEGGHTRELPGPRNGGNGWRAHHRVARHQDKRRD